MPGTFSPHRLIKREYCQVTYHYASMPIFSGSKVSLVSLVISSLNFDRNQTTKFYDLNSHRFRLEAPETKNFRFTPFPFLLLPHPHFFLPHPGLSLYLIHCITLPLPLFDSLKPILLPHPHFPSLIPLLFSPSPLSPRLSLSLLLPLLASPSLVRLASPLPAYQLST